MTFSFIREDSALKKIRLWHMVNSWQIEGGKVATVTDFIFSGSKITADGHCSHDIKRCLFLGRKVMTNLDSIINRGTSLC